MREQLHQVFTEVVVVDVMDSGDDVNLALLNRPELGVTFTKLRCWRLTQYSKCVFMDADCLVLQNVDDLFEREELSAAPDIGWPDCFNSGVFVFRPSIETFDALQAFALKKGSFDGDQGLLNAYFCNWATEDIQKHLPFVYNMTANLSYTYKPAYKRFNRDVKVVHFLGTVKPWHHHFNTSSGQVEAHLGDHHCFPHLQLWWTYFMQRVQPQLDPKIAVIWCPPPYQPPSDQTASRQAPEGVSVLEQNIEAELPEVTEMDMLASWYYGAVPEVEEDSEDEAEAIQENCESEESVDKDCECELAESLLDPEEENLPWKRVYVPTNERSIVEDASTVIYYTFEIKDEDPVLTPEPKVLHFNDQNVANQNSDDGQSDEDTETDQSDKESESDDKDGVRETAETDQSDKESESDDEDGVRETAVALFPWTRPLEEMALSEGVATLQVSSPVMAMDEGDRQRQQQWEQGRIDYLGSDSFDNIMKKLHESVSK